MARFIWKNYQDKIEDFPYVEVDVSHVSGLFQTCECVDAYEFMADVLKIEEFKFYYGALIKKM